MLNMIDTQDKLKNFSEDQLVREMQMPSGSAPQFMVLGEIERRKRMRADAQKQQGLMQPTVAQEAVSAAGVPQQGIAQIARSLAPKTDMAQNTGVPNVQAAGLPAQPNQPQRMAGGGIMRLAPGGQLSGGTMTAIASLKVNYPALYEQYKDNPSALAQAAQAALEVAEDPEMTTLEGLEAPYSPQPDGQGRTDTLPYVNMNTVKSLLSKLPPIRNNAARERLANQKQDIREHVARVDSQNAIGSYDDNDPIFRDGVGDDATRARNFKVVEDAAADAAAVEEAKRAYLAEGYYSGIGDPIGGTAIVDMLNREREHYNSNPYTKPGGIYPIEGNSVLGTLKYSLTPDEQGTPFDYLAGEAAREAEERLDVFERRGLPPAGGDEARLDVFERRGLPPADTETFEGSSNFLTDQKRAAEKRKIAATIAAREADREAEERLDVFERRGLPTTPTQDRLALEAREAARKAEDGVGTPTGRDRVYLNDIEDAEAAMRNYNPSVDGLATGRAFSVTPDAATNNVIQGALNALGYGEKAAVEVKTPNEDTIRPKSRPEGLGALTKPATKVGSTSAAAAKIGEKLSPREKQVNQDKWLALAQAGFTLMNTGDFGEAGSAGLAALRNSKQAALEERKVAASEALTAAKIAAAGRKGGARRIPIGVAKELRARLEGLLAAKDGLDDAIPSTWISSGSDPDAVERKILDDAIKATQGQIDYVLRSQGIPSVTLPAASRTKV